LVLISVFLFFVTGTSLFFSGLHNIDFSHNFQILENELDIKIIDTSVGGLKQTTKESYLSGIRMMYLSFVCFLASIIVAFFSGFKPLNSSKFQDLSLRGGV